MRPSFKVILWDINRKEVEYYDIMGYLLNTWETQEKYIAQKLYRLRRKAKRDFAEEDACSMPRTREEVKKWILDTAQYQFWGRCEYEVIIQEWPCQKDEQKIDAYDQIEANIDAITTLFYDYIKPI